LTVSKKGPPFSGVKSPTNPRYNVEYVKLEFW